METRNDIWNELKELSPLIAGLEKVNVFTVPEGYFEGLPGMISGLLGREDSAVLAGMPLKNPMTVPEGYFDTFAGSVLNRIKMQQEDSAGTELRALSPMLYSIQSENPYEVPQGYFAGLSDEILGKVKAPKIVTMRRRSSVFIRYAVAAAFTGIVALGAFRFISPSVNKDAEPSYVTAGLKITNVDEELAKVSDDDIIKYLQANGENIDAQTVANKALDEQELPSQADYLSDDKALDKYLDNINLNDLKN